MSISCYIIADIIHYIKILILCNMLLKFEPRKRGCREIVVLIGAVLMVLSSVATYVCSNALIVLLISVLSLSIILCAIYKETESTMIISAVWITFSMSLIDTMSSILMDVIVDLLKIDNQNVSRIGFAIISLVFIYFIGVIYHKKYGEGIKGLGIKNLLLFTLLVIVDAFVVMAMAGVTLKENLVNYKILYSVAFILVIIGIFIQLGAVILLFMQRNVFKEKKQITEKYLDEQISHYEYLERRETETKKFRHDLRNHMQVISDLAHNGEYEKIEHYLDVMNMKIENFGNLVTVQHGIVDSIINKYYSLALQSGISMNIKGIFPKECYIEPYDLCTIFSNVLSNALEATIEADEKVINLECRYNDKNIIIVVSNTYKDVGQFDGEKIKTRKDDIDYHGYGLTNIRESIQKHSGVLDIETKNGVFTISLMLNYVGNEVV